MLTNQKNAFSFQHNSFYHEPWFSDPKSDAIICVPQWRKLGENLYNTVQDIMSTIFWMHCAQQRMDGRTGQKTLCFWPLYVKQGIILHGKLAECVFMPQNQNVIQYRLELHRALWMLHTVKLSQWKLIQNERTLTTKKHCTRCTRPSMMWITWAPKTRIT